MPSSKSRRKCPRFLPEADCLISAVVFTSSCTRHLPLHLLDSLNATIEWATIQDVHEMATNRGQRSRRLVLGCPRPRFLQSGLCYLYSADYAGLTIEFERIFKVGFSAAEFAKAICFKPVLDRTEPRHEPAEIIGAFVQKRQGVLIGSTRGDSIQPHRTCRPA